jgi:hypothetical protein
MRPLLYRCPRTGVNVQALVAKEVIGTNTTLIPLDCRCVIGGTLSIWLTA